MSCVDNVKKYIGTIKQKSVVDLYNQENKSGKAHRFNTWDVTNDIMNDLFLGSKGDKSFAMNKVKGIVDSDKVYNSIKGILDLNSIDKNPILEGVTDPTSITRRGIAFNHIFGSLSSESNLVKQYNLNENELQTLTKDGVLKVSTYGLFTAIGRDIAYDL